MSVRIPISYLRWFAFPILTFLIISIPLSIFFEPLSGDLTRIGHWSERDFGWNKLQPLVPVRANGAAISPPQVLVLGDSFSHPNIWQSYLADVGKIDILSFQYQDVGCVDNWLNWVVEKNYSRMNTVIIQIVERSFISVFRKMNTCTRRVPKPLEIMKGDTRQKRPDFGLTLDATYLFPTGVNMLRMAWSEGRLTSGEVVNIPLSTGRLFSNRKSNHLLYYAEDENKKYWSEKDMDAALKNLKLIQDDLEKRGIKLLVVLVPDKSSAYRQFFANQRAIDGYPDIFEKLQASGVNNVNLLASFQQAAGEIVDLYLPNDTHLSTQGYKFMASKIAYELF